MDDKICCQKCYTGRVYIFCYSIFCFKKIDYVFNQIYLFVSLLLAALINLFI